MAALIALCSSELVPGAVAGGASGGPGGVVPPGGSAAEDHDLEYGRGFLMRQAGSLGGGSTEMARNIISERVLGMPREFAADRDVPFSQVRQGRETELWFNSEHLHMFDPETGKSLLGSTGRDGQGMRKPRPSGTHR